MPSPLVFKIFDTEQNAPREVNGYCNRRKDSLAIYKEADGEWHIIHKASGSSVDKIKPDAVRKYPALLAFCAFLQENAAGELAALDEMPFNPTADRKAAETTALTNLWLKAKTFNG